MRHKVHSPNRRRLDVFGGRNLALYFYGKLSDGKAMPLIQPNNVDVHRDGGQKIHAIHPPKPHRRRRSVA